MPIDLTRLPDPTAIETLDYDTLKADFISRFTAKWDELRADDPTLPAYDVGSLEIDPAVIAAEAWSELRLLDRQRVNDALLAVLVAKAAGANLDNIVARIGVERLTIIAATDSTDAVMESDARLLQRYLLAFTLPAAGSADRYLYEALTAWPLMLTGKVNGRAVHGRKGNVDIVIAGPGGRDATDEELAAVREACTSTQVKPEATSVSILRATRNVYDVSGKITIPSGPDADAVEAEAVARILAAGTERILVGAEVPVTALSGAAYGTSVIRVDLTSPPSDIAGDPYAVPVPGTISLTVEVAA